MEQAGVDVGAAPDYRVFRVGVLDTNCYLVWCTDTKHAVLIDPGESPEPALAEAERLGLRIGCVLATHGHFDHVMGVNEVWERADGVPFLLHPADHAMALAPSAQAEFVLGRPVPSVCPTGALEDGQVIEFGRCRLRVIHTPGHTQGGVCLSTDGMIFTGDTLFCGSVGRTDFEGGDWDQLMASIRDRLLPLPDGTRVLPGHGPETRIGDERETNPFLA
ncbi:MAG TPA: MBL fold metallo-hydrolase [Armatimonadota bacterium]|nr:MBL fold metallo-hydrolase [Armatimonadota bacterium]